MIFIVNVDNELICIIHCIDVKFIVICCLLNCSRIVIDWFIVLAILFQISIFGCFILLGFIRIVLFSSNLCTLLQSVIFIFVIHLDGRSFSSIIYWFIWAFRCVSLLKIICDDRIILHVIISIEHVKLFCSFICLIFISVSLTMLFNLYYPYFHALISIFYFLFIE